MEEKENDILSFLDIITLVLSIYVLIALFAGTIIRFDDEQTKLLDIIDNAICIYFLLEFCLRLYRTKEKLNYLKWGWIDLISSIPDIDLLRYGRIFRLIRILRILRAFRSYKAISTILYRNKPKGAFSTVGLFSFLTIIVSSIVILQVEIDASSNIKTAEDALWWSYVTVTTVGYGDRYPVTTEGRFIGAILMTVGVGLFGTFTGFVASWFLEKKTD